MKLSSLHFFALALFSSTPTLALEDWPQHMGPHGDGMSRETKWENQGRSVWEARVGLGYSTVSVVGNRLYTIGWEQKGEDEKSGEDVVRCLDSGTGEVVWSHRYPAQKWAKYHGGGTSTTPSIDGDRVYVVNREASFRCLDTATGKLHWARSLGEGLELETPTWGFAASPLILDDTVIVNVGVIMSCDKESGDPTWKTEKDYGHAYSTPTVFEYEGRSLLAVFCGSGLVILDRATGKEIAFQEWKTKYDVNAASPVLVGSDRFFISSGYGRGGAMVQFTGDALEVAWETKSMRNHMDTSCWIGDHLYGLDEAVLKCFDAEGEMVWSQRGIGKGAMSAAGDRLLVVSGEGELIVVEATPAEYRELSREKVVDGGVYWTMPVLVDGRIYARSSSGHLVCRDHSGGAQ